LRLSLNPERFPPNLSSAPEARNRLMGVREPQQAQEPDEDNLADDRIAVDEEGNHAANNGSFDQFENSHKTAFKLCPGLSRRYARLVVNAAVWPSAITIIR